MYRAGSIEVAASLVAALGRGRAFDRGEVVFGGSIARILEE